jgi:hypothetical protein
MRDLGRLLIILGLLIAVVGVVLATGNRLNLGAFPATSPGAGAISVATSR